MDFDQTLDFFRSTRRYKGSVKFDKHPVRTMLNEPILGMIYFNDQYRQDFINIEDLLDLNDEALTTFIIPYSVTEAQDPKEEVQFNQVGNASLNDVDLLKKLDKKSLLIKVYKVAEASAQGLFSTFSEKGGEQSGECQDGRGAKSKSLKEKTSKAERRALQEAQRAAKAAAK
ncbi:hypothetical protein Tco_0716097, partial [Tanacetum coccineum]